MRDALSAGGVEVNVLPVDAGSESFRTELLRASSEKPDAIYMVLQTDDAQATLLREATELGISVPLYIHYARGESDTFLAAAGTSAEGITYAAPRDSERMDEFRTKFRKRFGRDPAPNAPVAYDMTMLALEAMEQGAQTPEEIYAYVSSQQDRLGYSGLLEFDNGFLANGEAVVKKVENGARVVVA